MLRLSRLRDLATSELDCPQCDGPAFIAPSDVPDDPFGRLACRHCDILDDIGEDVELAPLVATRADVVSRLDDADRAWIARYIAAQRALGSALGARRPTWSELGLLFVEETHDLPCRNPQTGAPMVISGRAIPHLEPALALVQALVAEPRFPVARADAEASGEDPIVVWTPYEEPIAFGGRVFPQPVAEVDASALVELAREELAAGDRASLLPLCTLERFFARSEFASGNVLVARLDSAFIELLRDDVEISVEEFVDGWLRTPIG